MPDAAARRMPLGPLALAAALKAEAARLGFAAAGITRLRPSGHAEFLRRWLGESRHGDMAWLARPDSVEKRADPSTAWPGLTVAVVVAHEYAADPAEPAPDPSRGIIARYAQGRDYHRVTRGRLLALLRWLEAETGQALPAARVYVDTGPLLERELGRRAGLGWFGRNTMLIHPRRGSYFFLGALLLPIDLPADPPFEADHCGSCNACVEACPTGALLGRDADGGPVMDARLCISYLTIEHRGPIPPELRPRMGNRIFGCDICQEVCPFNRKFAAPAAEPAFAARGPGASPAGVRAEAPASADSHPGTASPALVDLFRAARDEASWGSLSRGSALRRAGRKAFGRNVVVALGNWGSPAAVPALSQGLWDPDPLTRAHAAWALGRTGSAEALAALEARLADEDSEPVREEILRALEGASSGRV